jgi:hypothetical protein
MTKGTAKIASPPFDMPPSDMSVIEPGRSLKD